MPEADPSRRGGAGLVETYVRAAGLAIPMKARGSCSRSRRYNTSDWTDSTESGRGTMSGGSGGAGGSWRRHFLECPQGITDPSDIRQARCSIIFKGLSIATNGAETRDGGRAPGC